MTKNWAAEEIWAKLGFSISDGEPRILTWESYGCHPASIAECALWDAYAERIKAYEEAVPAAEVYEYPRDHHEFNAPMLKGIRFTGMPLPVGAKLYAHPPAQVAQGDLVAWQIDTNDDVERVSKASGWDNRRYMTQADYAIWCNRMREFVRIAVDVPQPFLAAQPRTVPDDEIRSLIARLRHEDDSEDPVTSERRAGWRAALNAVDEAMFPAAPSPGESA